MGTKHLKYPRDCSGDVGKVVGPSANGRWYVITAARYDEGTDTTYVNAEQIKSPQEAFEAHLRGESPVCNEDAS